MPVGPRARRRRELHVTLTAAAAYLTMVVAVTAPASLHLGAQFLGSADADLSLSIWGYWWAHRAFITFSSPFESNLIGFPQGGVFFVADPLNSIFSIPLQVVFSLAASYNLVIMGNLLFAALAAFALLRHLRMPALAAFVGGAVYGLNPYVLAYVQNGVTQEVSVGWLPLFVLRFLILMRHGTIANHLWAGATLWLTCVSSWYHAGSAMLLIPFLVWPFRSRWRAASTRAARVVLLTMMLLTPYLMAQLYVLSDARTLESRQAVPISISLQAQDGSDLARFFWPGTGPIGHTHLHLPYLGLSVLALAIVAVTLSRRTRPARRWIPLTMFFFTLACGYFLEINGRLVIVAGRVVPLPFFFLFNNVPGFSWLHFAHRFIVPAYLGLAVMAGYGTTHVLAVVKRYARTYLPPGLRIAGAIIVTFEIVVLFLLETLFRTPLSWPLKTTPSTVPDFYVRAAADRQRYGIIDLPAPPYSVPSGKKYFVYQTVHGKGIPYAIDASRFSGAFGRSPALARLASLDAAPGFSLRHVDATRLIDELRTLGYRYIVIHAREARSTVLMDYRLLLDPELEATEEGDLLIYPIPPKATGP